MIAQILKRGIKTLEKWPLAIATSLLMTVNAWGQIRLSKMWQDGDYWKPETYLGHQEKGEYYAVDFYNNNRNRPDLFRNADNGEQGKAILAPQSGRVYLHLLDLSAYSGNFTQIDANRVIQGLDPIPKNSFSFNDGTLERKIDVELVIDATTFRTIYAHLKISNNFFSGAVSQKIKNAISSFLNNQASGALPRIAIDTGQNVTLGTQIGTVDKWGIAKGYHLHFQAHTGNGYSEGSPSLGIAVNLSDATKITLENQVILDNNLQANQSPIYRYPAMLRRRFMPNDRVIVNSSWDGTASVNLRSSAGGSVSGQVNHGVLGETLSGPTVAKIFNGSTWHVWWEVRFPSSTGWIAAEYIDASQISLALTQNYSFSQGLNLIAFPFTPKPARFSNLLEPLGSDLLPYVIFIDDNGNPEFKRTQDLDAVAKKGYFLYLQKPRQITLTGDPVERGITLRRSLNLVGVTERVTPTNNDKVIPFAIFIENDIPKTTPLFEGALEPGIGYFIYSHVDGNVLLPSQSSTSLVTAQSMPTEQHFFAKENDRVVASTTANVDFVVDFKAEQQGASNSIVLKLGIKPSATDGYDANLDLLRDIPLPGQMIGFFDEGFGFKESYKSNGNSKEWLVTIMSQTKGFGGSDNLNSVRLSWTIPSSGTLPISARFELLDANHNVLVADMKSNTSTSFNVGAPGTEKRYIVRMTIESTPTPPTVVTESATNITDHSAQLNGSVNPNGASTMYYFEYGTTTNYGTTTPTANAGSGTTTIPVSIQVNSLSANTEYHYRLVAKHNGDTEKANDQPFKTPPLPPDFFTDISVSLAGVYYGSAAWGDYDNDGDLDILLTGNTNSNQRLSKVYRNNGGNFSDISAPLEGVYLGSAVWGDYDNDGDLDILLTGHTTANKRITKIYQNDDGNFVDISAPLIAVNFSSAAWGDYDNDGDLDILLTGYDGSTAISKIYRNDGGGFFIDLSASLTGVLEGSAKWGDCDNDGDLDILLTGAVDINNSTFIVKIYRNDSGNFIEISAPLVGVYLSSAEWGDYDNDGDLDIILTGGTGSNNISKIYRNDGGSFIDISVSLTAVSAGSVAWGDYDNDGDLDLLLSGYVSISTFVCKLYRNDNGNFVEVSTPFKGVQYSSAAWGDYDNDKDLDILLTGSLGGLNGISKIYRNNTIALNKAPIAPANLAAAVTGNLVALSWDKATDTQTIQNALTYNLRLGSSPNGLQKVSPMANVSTGYRQIPQIGNTNHKTTWTIKNLSPGTYYWSVQTIDNAFVGSTFSAEKSFTILPTESFTDISAGLTGVSGSAVAWGDYDNDNDLDILLTGQAASGLAITKIYRNDKNNFSPIQTTLLGVNSGAVAWGDFDNDNDLDILLAGYTGTTRITKIYKNNGGSFAEHPTSLVGVSSGAVAWGDYDNDGDLDILLAGFNGSKAVAKVYRNDGGTFTDIAAALAQVQSGAALWGDYDNDGDLDILLTGAPDSGSPIAKIYRNDPGNFVDIQAPLIGVKNSSAAWGDYNQDGKLDILLAGETGSGRVTKVYQNDGNRFAPISTPLMGVMGGSVAWGDYDNDGDFDILLNGLNSTPARISKVYRNDGGNFSEIPAALIGVNVSSAVWGDYDNDGDLDILLAGANEDNSAVAKIYRNNILKRNTVPSAPAGLAATVKGNAVTLNWNKATDSQTAQNALTYNLRLGARSNGLGKLSPMSNLANGYRRVPRIGNTNHCTSWAMKNLPAGKYYWNVQAIDNAFAGSAFAAEQSFTVPLDTIPLPAVAAYGNIPGGDEAHVDKVIYRFPGQAGHVLLSYQAYDIDAKDEVAIFLNDVKVANVPLTGDNNWSGNLDMFLQDALVKNTGINTVVFDNSKNPPSGLIWGVRQASVSATGCVQLPDTTANGKIPKLDQAHANHVFYCFPGQPGDLSLAYEIYDIDDIHEVDILLNGEKVRDEAVTANNGWSGKRSLKLLDAQVNDAELNVLIFDNTKNPNPTWLWDWGVKNVSVAPALSKQDSILTMAAPETKLPVRYELAQNFPNPFNPSTTIHFALPVRGNVKLTVYNLNGEQIRTLVAKEMPAGNHSVKFDASGLASGTYLYRLEVGAFVSTRRMTLTK